MTNAFRGRGILSKTDNSFPGIFLGIEILVTQLLTKIGTGRRLIPIDS